TPARHSQNWHPVPDRRGKRQFLEPAPPARQIENWQGVVFLSGNDAVFGLDPALWRAVASPPPAPHRRQGAYWVKGRQRDKCWAKSEEATVIVRDSRRPADPGRERPEMQPHAGCRRWERQPGTWSYRGK